jgi:Tol biopolymer transport system component
VDADATTSGRFGGKAGALLALAAAAVTAVVAAAYVAGRRVVASPAAYIAGHSARRVTDFMGLEEFPSMSPDGRAVAFTSNVNGTRQIFVRLLAGGTPLAITKDAADHQQPRWSPDANSLVYFSPAEPAGDTDVQGTIWTIPALGGSPRRVMTSIGGVDVSRSGRIARFRLMNDQVQLVSAALDGSDVRVILPSVAGHHRYPRWSPDGRWIAFQRGDGVRYDIFVAPTAGGEVRQLTHDRNMISGLAWLPASDAIVYGSSRENSVPYLPSLRLWQVRLDGRTLQPITPPDISYEQPDVHDSGSVSAVRLRMRFDIWMFPFDVTAAESMRRSRQITRQTGQVLTPTASPAGDEVAFLADSGGHANLWVLSMRSGDLRQVTFESDPAVAVGVPVWSPDGRSIAFVSSKGRTGYDFGIWLVDPATGRTGVTVPRPPTSSPLAALRAIAAAYAELASSSRAAVRNLAYLQNDLADPALRRHLLRLSRAARGWYEQRLADAVAAGELRAGVDVPRLARSIGATLRGSILSWTLYREGPAATWLREDLDATLEPYLSHHGNRKQRRP